MSFAPLRRLYHWTLGWADHPSASWALFAIAFVESSCFPIPPDVLLIALGLGDAKRAFRFAAICTAGSVLGGIAGYGIGMMLTDVGHTMLSWFADADVIAKVEGQFRENAFLYIAIAGFTPIPYKVFTILAGISRIDFPTFVAASIASRGARFYLEAVLIRLFGDRARALLEKRLEWITVAVAIVGVGGFLAVKYLF